MNETITSLEEPEEDPVKKVVKPAPLCNVTNRTEYPCSVCGLIGQLEKKIQAEQTALKIKIKPVEDLIGELEKKIQAERTALKIKIKPVEDLIGQLEHKTIAQREALDLDMKPFRKELKKMIDLEARLRKEHRRCAGCGMCFGGDHLAVEFSHVEGVGDICQWCQRDLKKLGKDKWLERINLKESREDFKDQQTREAQKKAQSKEVVIG